MFNAILTAKTIAKIKREMYHDNMFLVIIEGDLAILIIHLLRVKGCINHFVKWVRPFNAKEEAY